MSKFVRKITRLAKPRTRIAKPRSMPRLGATPRRRAKETTMAMTWSRDRRAQTGDDGVPARPY